MALHLIDRAYLDSIYLKTLYGASAPREENATRRVAMIRLCEEVLADLESPVRTTSALPPISNLATEEEMAALRENYRRFIELLRESRTQSVLPPPQVEQITRIGNQILDSLRGFEERWGR